MTVSMQTWEILYLAFDLLRTLIFQYCFDSINYYIVIIYFTFIWKRWKAGTSFKIQLWLKCWQVLLSHQTLLTAQGY